METKNLKQQFEEQVLPHFELAITNNLLKFEIEDNWLSVYVKENLNAKGDEIKYILVCGQSLINYQVTTNNGSEMILLDLTLTNRITLMLAEKLRSALQDINILYENKKTRN